MANKITITIPKPCHENWQTMTVVDKGRFCNSCQKTVIDFTKISDREIVNIFNKTDNLCGRFYATQLNRDIIKPKEKNTVWIAASIAFLSFFSVGSDNLFSQKKIDIVQTDNNDLLNENREIEISGIVYDDNISPLPYTNVFIKGTNNGTITGIDGTFKIIVKPMEVLVFSNPQDFEEKEIRIEYDKFFYNIYLESVFKKIKMETHTVGMIVSYRKNFLQRTYHKIRNWFR
jgi:CarboxypepD_reg-like domain